MKKVFITLVACVGLVVTWRLIEQHEPRPNHPPLQHERKASSFSVKPAAQPLRSDREREAPKVEVAPLAQTEESELEPVDVFSGVVVEVQHLSNRGRATAKDTFESFLWGLVGGHHQTVADLTGNWTRQSEEVRRRRIQERIDSSAAFDRVQIVGQESFGPDHMVLRIHFIRPNSTISQDVVMMKRVNGQWYCL